MNVIFSFFFFSYVRGFKIHLRGRLSEWVNASLSGCHGCDDGLQRLCSKCEVHGKAKWTIFITDTVYVRT